MQKENKIDTAQDPTIIRVYRQDWHFCTRFILTNAGGSVQLDLCKSIDTRVQCDTLLWALWIDQAYRRKGYATALMNKAEELARKYNRKQIALEWDKRDTPCEIIEWYERRGYQKRAFADFEILMIKQLTK